MLARTSKLTHKASGVSIQTPLLIPSFSSKGFAVSKKEGISEIGKILTASSQFITEAFLVSAYDIYYKHLPKPKDFPYTPEIVFLDSGGYEVSTDRDYSSVIDPLPAPHEWSPSKWTSILSAWPKGIPLVAISYDHHSDRQPFKAQVANAQKRFKKFASHLHTFLLKPETQSQMTLEKALAAAIANVESLGIFDIIGVTEKELGRSMLDRMHNIAKLRLALDEAEIKSPIHVFGALDPISVCLYFIAGAEIFDGLTWIRYSYDNGGCIYTHNAGPLRYGLTVRDNDIKSRAMADNCYYLFDLQQRLREFEATSNFDKLKPHGSLLSSARDSLATRLKRDV